MALNSFDIESFIKDCISFLKLSRFIHIIDIPTITSASVQNSYSLRGVVFLVTYGGGKLLVIRNGTACRWPLTIDYIVPRKQILRISNTFIYDDGSFFFDGQRKQIFVCMCVTS